MKLKKYAKLIKDLAKKYPEADVCYSSDNEGNSFELVHYKPTMGYWDSDNEGFTTDDNPDVKPNAIVVN